MSEIKKSEVTTQNNKLVVRLHWNFLLLILSPLPRREIYYRGGSRGRTQRAPPARAPLKLEKNVIFFATLGAIILSASPPPTPQLEILDPPCTSIVLPGIPHNTFNQTVNFCSVYAFGSLLVGHFAYSRQCPPPPLKLQSNIECCRGSVFMIIETTQRTT